MRYFQHLLVIFFITIPYFAWANDATEAAPTSNIIFETTPELILQDETLTFTRFPGKNFGEDTFTVDVDFHFKNTSDHDITRKIAFVLPPVQCREDINSMWGGLDTTSNNTDMQNKGLKDFKTTVDGKSIVFTKRIEATLGQKKITTLLNKLKIPLNPCQIHLTSEGEPDPRFSGKLEKYHLLTESNDAAWSEEIFFEWEQVFPAGKVINIHHTYTPVIGMAVPSPRPISELNSWFTDNQPPMKPFWNRMPATLAKNHPNIISNDKTLYPDDIQARFCVMPEWIRYRLTTGATWQGGIGLFKLVIKDAEDVPFAVNEFYKKDDRVEVLKTENTITFTIKNFIPTEDLLILFLSLPQNAENLKVCPGVSQ